MSYYFNPHGHQCPWYPYSELLGYPSASRCEEVACYIMSEPTNTVSCLAIILMAVISSSARFKKNHPDIKLFTNIFLFSGVFLALFHTANNFATQLLAHGSLFFLMMIGITKNFMRMGKINFTSRMPTLLSSMFVFLLVSFILYREHLYPEIILPISFLILFLTDLKAKAYEENSNSSLLGLSLILFLMSSVVIYLDQTKYNCSPQSYFQLHSLGHILIALSLGLYFKHLYQFYPFKADPKVAIDEHNRALMQETSDIDEIHENESFDFEIEEEEFEELEDDQDEVDDVQIEFNFDQLAAHEELLDESELEEEIDQESEDDEDKKS